MGYNTRFILNVHPLKKETRKDKEDRLALIKKEISGASSDEEMKAILAVYNKPSGEDIISELLESSEGARYVLDDQGDSAEPGKWYEHETELKAFSGKYRGYIFSLYGIGEDSEDMWKKYFLNGKMQLAKACITYDAFDEKKLK